VFDAAGLAQFDEKINPGLAAGLKSRCFIPLVNRERVWGTMVLCRYTDSPFTSDDVTSLVRWLVRCYCVGNALEYDEVSNPGERLRKKSLPWNISLGPNTISTRSSARVLR